MSKLRFQVMICCSQLQERNLRCGGTSVARARRARAARARDTRPPMSLPLGTLDPPSSWSLVSCLAPYTNLSSVAAQSWAKPWLAYSQPSWTRWMAQLSFCALPAKGKFRPPLTVQRHSRCTCHADWCMEEHSWSNNTGEATPSGTWMTGASWLPDVRWASQGFAWLSPSDVLSCLAGRIVIFEGDSLTRQVFLRLVWWLRGTTHMVEHYFSQHAAYTFNSTHDSFVIFGREPMRAYSRATDRYAEACLLDHLVSLDAWGPTAVTLVFRWASQKKWLGPSPSIGFFHRVRPRVVAIARGFAGHFSLTWPAAGWGVWRRQVFDLDAMNADADGEPHFFRRARLCVRDQSLDAYNSSLLEFGAGSCTIDGDAVLAKGGQRQHGHPIPPNQHFYHTNDQDIHFECSFANQWPSPIVGWKMPENGDCRGIMSLNIAQLLLNRIAWRGAGS